MRCIWTVNGSLGRWKTMKKSDLPQKTCVVCGRPFAWRKKWAKVWDEVKYCSIKCRKQKSNARAEVEGCDGPHAV